MCLISKTCFHPITLDTAFQTVDNYWSNNAVCTIPGSGVTDYLGNPVNKHTYYLCGADAVSFPLTDVTGKRYGNMFWFVDYSSIMYITVLFDGAPFLERQPFYDLNYYTKSSSVFLWFEGNNIIGETGDPFRRCAISRHVALMQAEEVSARHHA